MTIPRTDNDSWEITQSVGATALGVAAARAAETESANPLIRDPFARLFVEAAGEGMWSNLADAARLVGRGSGAMHAGQGSGAFVGAHGCAEWAGLLAGFQGARRGVHRPRSRAASAGRDAADARRGRQAGRHGDNRLRGPLVSRGT